MVKTAKRPQETVKKNEAPRQRAPRSARKMAIANKKTDVLPRDARMRQKAVPRRTKAAVKKRNNTAGWRKALNGERRAIFHAIQAAAARFRSSVTNRPRVRRKGVYKKALPKVVALRPDNFDKLLTLIEPPQRSKPTATGQEVVYVLPGAAPVLSWFVGKVVHLAAHKESNWFVVAKPWVLKPGENGYIAIDSTNVYLAPPGSKPWSLSLLKDRGLYTLYCRSRDEYYVGASNDIPRRVREHEAGKGSAVTKKWKGEVERLRPLTNGKGLSSAAELKEVWALVKKFYPSASRSSIYAEHEGSKVRGAGYSVSQE